MGAACCRVQPRGSNGDRSAFHHLLNDQVVPGYAQAQELGPGKLEAPVAEAHQSLEEHTAKQAGEDADPEDTAFSCRYLGLISRGHSAGSSSAGIMGLSSDVCFGMSCLGCAAVATILVAAAIVTRWQSLCSASGESAHWSQRASTAASSSLAKPERKGAALGDQSHGEIAAQRSRLRVTNACADEPMWVAFHGVGSEHLAEATNFRLAPLESRDYSIPSEGFPGTATTRWWAKWRCADDGNSCAIGDSGGDRQVCEEASGCAPPVDTKFSARFGDVAKTCDVDANVFAGCDFVDVSLQDGFTTPFQLRIKGDCTATQAKGVGRTQQVVDCSNLTLDNCPRSEDLGVFGRDVDLHVVNPSMSVVAGCYSPCGRLIFGKWSDHARTHVRMAPPHMMSKAVSAYCCPDQEDCKDGAIAETAFAHAVREMCPGVNAYDYDQGMGVGTCPAGTEYEMFFFCPPHAMPLA
mmetsp:Transcript_75509/g.219346  ORF Transcript_75509/g.219346 Transcript_75509/m.219346 type:complete len:465 (+) Transcript_75509:76-1470(+)|eukprot:CAMPEP_0176044040 /NCGR_PEP_ID=MMETSP0120_2-20121206/21857_1 /TAXON_ID=160619 /ORGANISM="Kryptoperidinium foliaceum, Strain CCMP 1326" /LENGTH=464 /DNA_ID=CAMNT_0017377447 /DNA_START=73 /DNA_END=1467 /DNA_ORIENTATION=-